MMTVIMNLIKHKYVVLQFYLQYHILASDGCKEPEPPILLLWLHAATRGLHAGRRGDSSKITDCVQPANTHKGIYQTGYDTHIAENDTY